jgi:hypothetical protein
MHADKVLVLERCRLLFAREKALWKRTILKRQIPHFRVRHVVRLRQKLQKPSNDAAFERLKDWLFMLETPHVLGLRWVYDAVVVVATVFHTQNGTQLGLVVTFVPKVPI